MNWRKWNKIIHRDIGYLAAGLTVIYAISGIAVNHVNEWNPNYIITKDTLLISDVTDSLLSSEDITSIMKQSLNITDTLRSTFKPAPDKLEMFFENKTVKADLKTGVVVFENVKTRPVIKETNFLHLNNPKKLWTYVADAFAVALALLAITGLFMIKGKNGITGRGLWLTAIGLLIPIVFLIAYL